MDTVDIYMLFPAHAGVILIEHATERKLPAFPRPRGGDPQRGCDRKDPARLFPAHAGVILSHVLSFIYLFPFPRPRGGDLRVISVARIQPSFSPPTRG